MGFDMGWRADKAYEEAQRDAFRRWRKALTWREYWRWQWGRWKYVLAGGVMAGAGSILWLVLA
jgi:hypothetical protein